MLKRLKNIWYLSGLEIASDTYRQIKLSIPRGTERPKKRLATILEEQPDMFKDLTEEIDTETLRKVLG